ncbi:MAG: cytidine deaminase [Elusimicrobia bacterium]|nr:cytidine deaminase [Elusimicrobiota bacterium]
MNRTKAEVDTLLAAAAEAQRHARCSFSRFPVGAAVLGASGRVYPGCNIESPTLIHHVCAERAAIFNAISHGERSLVAVCTVSRTAYPCGTCRQAILEFVEPGAPIYSVLGDPGAKGSRLIKTTAAELVPHAYTEKQMRAGRARGKRTLRGAKR